MHDDSASPHTDLDTRGDVDASQLTATAYHEAGHAVMALSLGRPIHRVTIKPGKSPAGEIRLGACEIQKGRRRVSKHAMEDEVLILFAGMVAEARCTGTYCQHGARRDLLSIRRLLKSCGKGESQCERVERRLLEKTEHVLRDEAHSQAIELIAGELIQKTTISGRAVRHFFAEALRQVS